VGVQQRRLDHGAAALRPVQTVDQTPVLQDVTLRGSQGLERRRRRR